MNKKNLLLMVLILMIGVISADTFSVQGVLRDPLGKTVEDGYYSVTFKLYEQAENGTAIWTEVQSSIQTTHGVFGAELGTETPLDDVPFDTNYWIGISIDDGVEMEPRYKITRSPSAMSVYGTDNILPSVGNMGIGTHEPNAALHIKNKNDEANVLLIEDSSGNIQVKTTDDGKVGVGVEPTADLHIKTANANDKLLIEGVNGTKYVRVMADGKMGLNLVDAPTQALDVNGNINMRTGGAILFDDGSSLSSAYFGGSASSLTNNGNTIITTDADENGTGEVQIVSGSSTIFTIANNGDVDATNVTASGDVIATNIGIGTTTPDVKLQIVGGSDASLTGGGYFQMGASTGENMIIDNNEIIARDNGVTSLLYLNKEGGDVQIGGTSTNTNQEANLTVNGNIATTDLNANGNIEATNLTTSGNIETTNLTSNGKIYLDNNGFGGAASIDLAVGDTDTGLDSAGDGQLDFYANNNKTMSVRSGKVGISNDDPDVKLHVLGGTDVEVSGGGFIQAGTTDGENFVIDSNEIMARNNGASSILYINNEGGDVRVGGDLKLKENVRVDHGNPDLSSWSKPFQFRRYTGSDNSNGTITTSYSADDWIGAVVGFDAGYGDINEGGSHDLWQCNAFVSDGVWKISLDAPTHNNSPDWQVYMMFVSRQFGYSSSAYESN